MQVRAKFKVQTIQELNQGSPERAALIVLNPVWGDGKDNASWSKWTPQGKLEMVVTNPTAIDAFALGQDYYIDFTPVET